MGKTGRGKKKEEGREIEGGRGHSPTLKRKKGDGFSNQKGSGIGEDEGGWDEIGSWKIKKASPAQTERRETSSS